MLGKFHFPFGKRFTVCAEIHLRLVVVTCGTLTAVTTTVRPIGLLARCVVGILSLRIGLVGAGGLGGGAGLFEDLLDKYGLRGPRTGFHAECLGDGGELFLVLCFQCGLFEGICGHDSCFPTTRSCGCVGVIAHRPWPVWRVNLDPSGVVSVIDRGELGEPSETNHSPGHPGSQRPARRTPSHGAQRAGPTVMRVACGGF